MKKLFITINIAMLCLLSIAQDTAKVNILVVNELGKPIAGEQIIFEAQDSSLKIINNTNDEGKFKALLLGGKTYNIKIKTVGEAKNYNTFKIPKLGEGKKYSESLLTITIYETKSFTLDNVYFDSGKSTFKKESYKELNELFQFMTLKKTLKIQIEGHTDSDGEAEANLVLSEKRAESVKKFLIEKGIFKDRISIKAFGEMQAIASNETAEGRALNRRIEVIVK